MAAHAADSAVQAGPATAVQATLEHLRAANAARQALAAAQADWQADRERLKALVDGAKAEATRLEAAAIAAEQAEKTAQGKLTASGIEGDLDRLRQRLADAGAALNAQLDQLRLRFPPGTLTGSTSDTTEPFDAAVARIDAGERAASEVAVEVVTGKKDDKTQAVKLLRVSGAAGWWEALDGAGAGTAQMESGTLRLSEVAEPGQRDAIHRAIAIAEGRSAPAVVLLPEARP
ncbi:hypothetical protein LBMAG53_16520 [Planctomycetota bacterium]|nr:hypothetical protein LBMAG53_16520 [Planctomycetota bacterium]